MISILLPTSVCFENALLRPIQVFLDQMVDINPNHQMKGRNVSPIPGLQTFSV